MNVFPSESIDAVFGAVVDQIIPHVQIFVVSQNHPLIGFFPRCNLTQRSLSLQAVWFSQGAVERI